MLSEKVLWYFYCYNNNSLNFRFIQEFYVCLDFKFRTNKLILEVSSLIGIISFTMRKKKYCFNVSNDYCYSYILFRIISFDSTNAFFLVVFLIINRNCFELYISPKLTLNQRNLQKNARGFEYLKKIRHYLFSHIKIVHILILFHVFEHYTYFSWSI